MKLTFLKLAEKTLFNYDKSLQMRIGEAISKLPNGDIKKMKGKGKLNIYRLRVGKYRIVFELSSDEIIIVKIDSRGDVYKD